MFISDYVLILLKNLVYDFLNSLFTWPKNYLKFAENRETFKVLYAVVLRIITQDGREYSSRMWGAGPLNADRAMNTLGSGRNVKLRLHQSNVVLKLIFN